jgi:hypothetical protein
MPTQRRLIEVCVNEGERIQKLDMICLAIGIGRQLALDFPILKVSRAEFPLKNVDESMRQKKTHRSTKSWWNCTVDEHAPSDNSLIFAHTGNSGGMGWTRQ